MAHAQRSGADEDQASRIPENETTPPTARKGLPRSRVRRPTIVTVAAAAVVLAGGALAVNHFAAGSSTSAGVVNGNTVEYAAGHRPLAPDLTATSLTGTPIKLSGYLGKIPAASARWPEPGQQPPCRACAWHCPQRSQTTVPPGRPGLRTTASRN